MDPPSAGLPAPLSFAVPVCKVRMNETREMLAGGCLRGGVPAAQEGRRRYLCSAALGVTRPQGHLCVLEEEESIEEENELGLSCITESRKLRSHVGGPASSKTWHCSGIPPRGPWLHSQALDAG